MVTPRAQRPGRPGQVQVVDPSLCFRAAEEQAEAVVAPSKAQQRQAVGFGAKGCQRRHLPEHGITPVGLIGAACEQPRTAQPGGDEGTRRRRRALQAGVSWIRARRGHA